MHCYELHLDNFKGDYLDFFYFAPSGSRFSNIALSLQTIHQWKSYLFKFQMMYKSQFHKLTLLTGFLVQGHYLKYY